MLDNILITGITDLECYPPTNCTKYYKQCIENDILCVPDEKPDIESINEIKVNMCIEYFEIFKTILGPKLLINGVKKIKVLYTANNSLQSLHSAHWCIPFCEFILLKGLYYEKCFNSINNVFIGVENVCLKYYDKRLIDLSLLFIICPEFQNNSLDCQKKPNDNCYNNYYNSKPNQNKNNFTPPFNNNNSSNNNYYYYNK